MDKLSTNKFIRRRQMSKSNKCLQFCVLHKPAALKLKRDTKPNRQFLLRFVINLFGT